MKHNKANMNAAGAAVLIVMVTVIALVVPWTLSLVDTTPPVGLGPGFELVVGSSYSAWASQQMKFTADVEIASMSADLTWGAASGSCTAYGQIQISNVVGAAAAVQFRAVEHIYPDDGIKLHYSALTLSGINESLSSGQYYLAINMNCVEPSQADNWHWNDYGGAGEVKTEPPGIVEVNKFCVDIAQVGTFSNCVNEIGSFTIEGELPEDAGNGLPPSNGNGNGNGDDIDDTLVDTIGEEDDALLMDWWIYVAAALVIIVVVIIFFVAYR